jgi:ribosome maturation factor RimP
MAVSKKVETLTELLTPAVAACGLELWGVEFFQQGRHSVLRLYIELPLAADAVAGEEGGRGVSVEDCSRVSHQASGILDVEDPIAGEYVLEVSSPGWDRPLFTLAQYERFIGAEASVRLSAPMQGRRRFKGPIQGVTATEVEMLVDGVAVTIPFLAIDKANIVPTD